MSEFTAIDIATLPEPDIFQDLTIQEDIDSILSTIRTKAPKFTATSYGSPVYAQVETFVYRETLMKQAITDAVKSVMLAYSSGSDLDHYGNGFNVYRLVIQEADDTVYPPIEAVYEDDERFRMRIHLKMEALNTAGAEGAYYYWGYTASTDIKSLYFNSPAGAVVDCFVLSGIGNGVPSQEILDLVKDILSGKKVIPMADRVNVYPAIVTPYELIVNITLLSDSYDSDYKDSIISQVRSNLEQVVFDAHRLGFNTVTGYVQPSSVSLSKIYAAIQHDAISHVEINLTENIIGQPYEALWCEDIVINIVGGNNE